MLAGLDDLVAIGAIATNADSAIKSRAVRLLELASAQVCAYLSTTETALTGTISTEQATSLAAIVAECAGSRINRSLAPSTDAWTGTGYESALLNKWHKQQIDELVGLPGRGSNSFAVERDSTSSFLTTPWAVDPNWPTWQTYDFDVPT